MGAVVLLSWWVSMPTISSMPKTNQVKKGYHFIVYRDNRITLLCDHDEYQQVVTFARQFLKASPYRTN